MNRDWHPIQTPCDRSAQALADRGHDVAAALLRERYEQGHQDPFRGIYQSLGQSGPAA